MSLRTFAPVRIAGYALVLTLAIVAVALLSAKHQDTALSAAFVPTHERLDPSSSTLTLTRSLKERTPAILAAGIGPKLNVELLELASRPGAPQSAVSQLAAPCNAGYSPSLCNSQAALIARDLMLDNRGGIGTQAFLGPADAHGAVSPLGNNVSVTNGTVRFEYSLPDQGTLVTYEKALRDFWADPANGNPLSEISANRNLVVFDPVAHYDKKNERFIIAALALDQAATSGPSRSLLLLAVSASSVPDRWQRHSIVAQYDGRWLDRIEMAGNSDTIGITGNYFLLPGSSAAADTTSLSAAFFIDKAQLYRGTLSLKKLNLSTYGIMLADDPEQTSSDFLGFSNYPDSQPGGANIGAQWHFVKAPAGWTVEEVSRVRFGWKRVPEPSSVSALGGEFPFFNVKMDSRVLQCARYYGTSYCVQNAKYPGATIPQDHPYQSVWVQWGDTGDVLQWGYIAPRTSDFGNRVVDSGPADSTLPTAVPAVAVDSAGVAAFSFRAANSCASDGRFCGGILASAWRFPSTPIGSLHYGQAPVTFPQVADAMIDRQTFTAETVCDPSTGNTGVVEETLPPNERFHRTGDYGLMVSVGSGVFYAHQGAGTGRRDVEIRYPSTSSACSISNIFITKWYPLDTRAGNLLSTHAFPAVAPADLVVSTPVLSNGKYSLVVANQSDQPAANVAVELRAGSGVNLTSLSAGSSATCSSLGSEGRCNIAGIPAKQSLSISFEAVNGAAAAAIVTAHALAANGDRSVADNGSSVSVSAAAPNPGPTPSPGSSTNSGGGGGGGGCTAVAGEPTAVDPVLWMLVLAAVVVLYQRHRPRR